MGNNNQSNTNEEPLTLTQELILRYKQRLKMVWKEPNPYFVKGIFPTEYQEIKQWVEKLEKIVNKS